MTNDAAAGRVEEAENTMVPGTAQHPASKFADKLPKGWFCFPEDAGMLEQELAERGVILVEAERPNSGESSNAAREAVAEWLYDFDSDGKPHRAKWSELSDRNRSGFRACGGELIAKLAEMGVIPQWRDIASAPKDEQKPFEIWWESGLDGWIPLAVSRFEGNLYPCFKGGNIDWSDRIEGAKLWRPITPPPPESGT